MCPRLGRQLTIAGGDDGAGSGSLSGMRGAVSGVYGARSPAASSVAPSSPPPPPEIELEIESWNAPNHASKLPPPASGLAEEDEAEDEGGPRDTHHLIQAILQGRGARKAQSSTQGVFRSLNTHSLAPISGTPRNNSGNSPRGRSLR